MTRNQSIEGLNPLFRSMVDLTASSYFPSNASQQIDLKPFASRGWDLYQKRFNALLIDQKWEEAQALLPAIAAYNRLVAPLMTIDPRYTVDRFEQRYTEGRFDQLLLQAADAVNRNQHIRKFDLLADAHQFYRQYRDRIGADDQRRLQRLTNNTMERTIQFIDASSRPTSFIAAQEAIHATQAFYQNGYQDLFTANVLSPLKGAIKQFFRSKLDHVERTFIGNQVGGADFQILDELVDEVNRSTFVAITDLEADLQHAYDLAVERYVDQSIQRIENGRYDFQYAIDQLVSWQEQQPTYIPIEVVRKTQLYLTYLSGYAQGEQALGSGHYQVGLDHYQRALMAYQEYPDQEATLLTDLQGASTQCLSQLLTQKLSIGPLSQDDNSRLQYYGDILALRKKYSTVQVNQQVEKQLVPVQENYYELACAALQQEIQEHQVRAQEAIDQKGYTEANAIYQDALTKVQESFDCGFSASDLRQKMKAIADAAYFQKRLQGLGLDEPKSESKSLFDQYEELWAFYQEKDIYSRFGLTMFSLVDYVSSTTNYPFHHQFIVRYGSFTERIQEVKRILKRLIEEKSMASEAALKQTAAEFAEATYTSNLGKNYKGRFNDFTLTVSDKSAKKRFKVFEKAYKKAWKGME